MGPTLNIRGADRARAPQSREAPRIPARHPGAPVRARGRGAEQGGPGGLRGKAGGVGRGARGPRGMGQVPAEELGWLAGPATAGLGQERWVTVTSSLHSPRSVHPGGEFCGVACSGSASSAPPSPASQLLKVLSFLSPGIPVFS